jgi:hypothetical protein
MLNFYKVNFRLPKPEWHMGVILISKAFNLKPDDYRHWEIYYWKQLTESAKKTIEAMNKVL